MALQEPDLDYARKFGKQVGESLFEELLSEYKMHNQLFVIPDSKKRWAKAKREFIKSVEELFVEDACNGF
jgi:hypothetical protein